ncbi:MAG: hypothetical protein C0447_14830 [Methylobacterium sp.]|nr:hypothetical protein [Methylobacterium sp.]
MKLAIGVTAVLALLLLLAIIPTDRLLPDDTPPGSRYARMLRGGPFLRMAARRSRKERPPLSIETMSAVLRFRFFT